MNMFTGDLFKRGRLLSSKSKQISENAACNAVQYECIIVDEIIAMCEHTIAGA